MSRPPRPLPASLPVAFTRAEGLAMGVPEARMRGGLVFCKPGASELDCVRAWVRTLPPGWAASHHTAALLLGLPLPARRPPGAEHIEVPLHATGPASNRPRRRGAHFHTSVLAPPDVVVVGGVPVTAPAKTFRDLAGQLAMLDLVALGDRAAQLAGGVARLESACSSGRHVVRAREAVALLDPRAETAPESRLRVLMRIAGLPPAEAQVERSCPVLGWLGRVDLDIDAFGTVVEHLGVDHFDPRKVRADYDPERRVRFVRAGREYVEITSSLTTVGEALTALSRIADALSTRGWCGSVSKAAVVAAVRESSDRRVPWRPREAWPAGGRVVAGALRPLDAPPTRRDAAVPAQSRV